MIRESKPCGHDLYEPNFWVVDGNEIYCAECGIPYDIACLDKSKQ